MQVYLETSALLSTLLEEPDGAVVDDILNRSQRIWTSDLTRAESCRAFSRLQLPVDATARLRLQGLQAVWNVVPILDDILAGVCQVFAVEPVRTLDAIHLCTALRLRTLVAGLVVISYDQRVRENALAFGFPVLP